MISIYYRQYTTYFLKFKYFTYTKSFMSIFYSSHQNLRPKKIFVVPIMLFHFFIRAIIVESEVFEPEIIPKTDNFIKDVFGFSMTTIVYMAPVFLSLNIINEINVNYKHLLKLQGLPMTYFWLSYFLVYFVIQFSSFIFSKKSF